MKILTNILLVLTIAMTACNPLNKITPTYKFRVEICKGPAEVVEICVPQINCNMDYLKKWLLPYRSSHNPNVYKFYCVDAEIKRSPIAVTITGIGYGLHTDGMFTIDKKFTLLASDFKDMKIKNTIINFIILKD